MYIKKILFLFTISAGYVSSISFTHVRHKRVSGNDYLADLDETLEGGDDYYTAYDSYEYYNYETFSCEDNRGKIALLLLCDGFIDCFDGSDEKPTNCKDSDSSPPSSSPAMTTSPTELRITTTTQDIIKPALNMLDDDGDYPSCFKGEFQCSSDWSVCLPASQVCDGIDDCPEREDELSCFGNHQGYNSSSKMLNVHIGTECLSINSYRCRSRPGDCVPNHLLCDSYPDCQDGSDEERCHCGIGKFSCINGGCVDASNRCDGIDDCGDRSDEMLGCAIYLTADDERAGKAPAPTAESSVAKTSFTELWNYTELGASISTAPLTTSAISNDSYVAEERVGICDLLPCANGGVCVDTSGYFYCICQSKYTGPTCLQMLSPAKGFDSSPSAKIRRHIILLSFLMSLIFRR